MSETYTIHNIRVRTDEDGGIWKAVILIGKPYRGEAESSYPAYGESERAAIVNLLNR